MKIGCLFGWSMEVDGEQEAPGAPVQVVAQHNMPVERAEGGALLEAPTVEDTPPGVEGPEPPARIGRDGKHGELQDVVSHDA